MPVISRSSLPSPAAEQGYTMIELLVAMTLSIIVVGALFEILIFSTHQASRVSEQVRADAIGRTVMTKIVDELHSSCTGFNATAIQGPSSTPTAPLASSGATDLWFLSAYGTATSGNATLSTVVEHDVHWTSTGTSNTGLSLGTLTDYSFQSTGGSSPNWTFPTLAPAQATTTQILAKNVIPPTSPSPMFQFYKFSSPSTAELEPLASSAVPTAAAKSEVAKVRISFTQAAEKGDTRAGRTASFTNSVVFRFNPAETGTEAVNVPCA